MTNTTHIVAIILLGICMFSGCNHVRSTPEGCEIAISRCLEKAIEIGERYLEERALIENIALTEGTPAAVKVYDELHHREKYEAFWNYLDEAENISKQVKDTLKQQQIISHLTPYINRIIILEDQILP